MSTFGSKTANDTGDWQNNKEMNPAANSSATEDGVLEDNGGTGNSEQSTADGAYKYDTGDPGRTPGKAEGVEDPEEDGNE